MPPCPLPAPHSSVLLLLNAVGYVVALATGLVDPLPGPPQRLQDQRAARHLGRPDRRRPPPAAAWRLTLLACTVSLAAAAFDGDLGAAGLGAGQVAIQLGIAAASPRALLGARPPRVWPRPTRDRGPARRILRDAPARRPPRRAGRSRRRAPTRKRLVRYDVTGGLAPASERLVVDTDGHARQTGRAGVRSFKLTAKQLRGLKRDLKDARFKSLKRSYQPEFPVHGRPDPDGQLQGPLDLRLDDGQDPEAPQSRAAPPRAADAS